MVQIVLCDRCKLEGAQVTAHFRLTFEYLGTPIKDPRDHPMDLCKEHYEVIWRGL